MQFFTLIGDCMNVRGCVLTIMVNVMWYVCVCGGLDGVHVRVGYEWAAFEVMGVVAFVAVTLVTFVGIDVFTVVAVGV